MPRLSPAEAQELRDLLPQLPPEKQQEVQAALAQWEAAQAAPGERDPQVAVDTTAEFGPSAPGFLGWGPGQEAPSGQATQAAPELSVGAEDLPPAEDGWRGAETDLEWERSLLGATATPAAAAAPLSWQPEGEGRGLSQMLGGERADWFEPTEGMFTRETGKDPTEAGAGFEEWKEAKWMHALTEAQAEGRPIRRIEKLIESGEATAADVGLSWLKGAGDVAYGFGKGLTGGLTSMLDPQEAQVATETPLGEAGYVAGLFNPLGLAGQAGRAAYGAVRSALPGAAGRVAAPVAGAAGAAVVQDVPEALTAADPGTELEALPSRLALDVPLGVAGVVPSEILASGARGARTALRSGVTPSGTVTPGAALGVPSPLANELKALDAGGVRIKGVGRELELPYPMQQANYKAQLRGAREGSEVTPQRVVAERAKPIMDEAALAAQREIEKAGQPIRQFEESVQDAVPLDEAVAVTQDIISNLRRQGRSIPFVPAAHMRDLEKSLALMHDVKAIRSLQGKKLLMANPGAAVMPVEEARRIVGDEAVNEALRAIDKPPLSDSLPGSLPGSAPSGIYPTASDTLPGSTPGLDAIWEDLGKVGPATIPDVPVETRVGYSILLEPARLTPKQLDTAINQVDELAKLTQKNAGDAGGPTVRRFERISAALRDARDHFEDTTGIFAGEKAVLPATEYRGEKKLTGYSAAKAKLDKLIRDRQGVLEGAGYRGQIKAETSLGAGQPPRAKVTPAVSEAVTSSLAQYGNVNLPSSNKAFERLAGIHEKVSGSPALKSELQKIRAFLAVDRIAGRGDLTSNIKPIVSPGGVTAYSGAGMFEALKRRSDALARAFESVGHSMPLPEGIANAVRGGKAPPRFGGRGLPPLMPDVGLAGGVTPGLAAVTYGELTPQEKHVLISLLMEEPNVAQTGTDEVGLSP